MKLRSKLRISYIGVVILAVAIVLVLIVDNANRELKEKIGKDLQSVAQIEAEDIDSFIKSKATRMNFFSRDTVLLSNKTNIINNHLAELIEDRNGYNEILIADVSGKIAASGDGKAVGTNFLARGKESSDMFKEVSGAGKREVFFGYISGQEEGKRLRAVFMAPLFSDIKKPPDKILVAYISLDPILKPVGRFDDLSSGERGTFLIDSPSTMIITQEGESQMFTPVVYIQADSPIVKGTMGVASGYKRYKDSKGNMVIAGYSGLLERGPEGHKRWSVISMAPQKAVFAPAVRLRNKIMALALIAVAIAWGAAFFLARGITRSIGKLVTVADRIAGGDLSEIADESGDDEVGELSGHFNRMTDKLRGAIAIRDREIIERRNIEETLREEIEDKARLVSMISDEFKTPLTTIKEGVAALFNEASGGMDERQKSILNLAKRSSENLSRLVKDVVDLHKLSTERETLSFAKNDVNKAVEEVHKEIFSLLVAKKDLELVIEKLENLPEAEIDKEKIKLALANIINSSIAMSEKPRIIIATGKEGENEIRVSVRNASAVMLKEDIPSLFRKPEEQERTGQRGTRGVGLALSISKEIINRHEGRIWAETSELDGTSLIFTIPVAQGG